jgi:subtilisin-like proprotein convertase family protein
LSITTTTYGPSARSDTYLPGEGQKVWAYLTIHDTLGNRREQSIGPVYADTPFTPDYLDRFGIGNPGDVYRGWMESGCSQVGVDRRVNRSAPAGATLKAIQRFYTTWNSEALRMTWTGANWTSNGDLFVYLDVAPGGTTTAYNPYGAGPAIHLPGVTPTTTVGAMAADYLVWVRDAQTATLLRWNGSAWVVASDMAQNAQFQFIAGVNDGQTDLYLPFSLLGISNPATTALDVVAFASEENVLNLWAAMPNGNPLNSPRIVGAISSAAPAFALSYRYHWDNLGPGICPNGSLTPAAPQYTDSDLHASLTVAPAGALRRMDAAQRWAWQALGGDPADVDWLLGMAEAGALLGDASLVTFTLRVENWGTVTATGALGDISSYHALRLPAGSHLPSEFRDHLVVNLGDVGPGTQASQDFTGRVDRATALAYYTVCAASQPDYACFPYLQRATLEVQVYDDAHQSAGHALDRFWSRHLADTQPPEFMGILQPGYLIAARNNTLMGYAYDESGVPTVTLTITGPTGLPSQRVCLDSTPADGRWTCAWDTTGAADGDIYNLSIQATDRYGQTGSASRPRAFLVDALPPTVTLDLAASHLDVSNVIGSSQYPLYGTIADNRGLGGLDVCVDGRCAAAQLWPGGGDTAHVYDDVPAAPLAIGTGTACGSGAVVRTFVVTDSIALESVTVGLDIEHVRRDDVQAVLTSPAGTQVRLLYHSGATGAYRANYDLFLDDTATSAYPAGGDDNPAAAYYDRPARPNEPLQAFYGEDSAGTWTLSICDLIPASGDGLYQRSRLILQPRETAPLAGNWTYMVSNSQPMDWVTQTVSLYGEDLVGNRMTTPLTVEVIVDNVPPVITTTQLARSLGLTLTVAALTGTATDGGRVAAVFVTVDGPQGVYLDTAVLNGNRWRYDLHPLSPGTYRLQVTAVDLAGNLSATPTYDVEIRPVTHTYLPLVARRHTAAPDLVVANIIARPGNVQVVIMNRGNAPVEDEFWVDAYIAPRTPPTRVNQTWDQLGSQGLVWGVTSSALPALVPGGTLTLTVGDAYYWQSLSRVSWPLRLGTPVYVQVDSVNAATTYGGVLERHEIIGEDYNNIEDAVVVAALGGTQAVIPLPPGLQPPQSGNLPTRR